MAVERVYQGIRTGDTWLAKGPITYPQAEDLIVKHLRGSNKDLAYSLEEEGDHLAMVVSEDEAWDSAGNNRSSKRSEYPKP